MRTFLFEHPMLKKLLFSFCLIIVFLIGRYIPLPNVALSTTVVDSDSPMGVAVALTGGNLSQIGLFSLGLGPWMYSMILGRVFTLGSQKKSGTILQDKKQLQVMLVVAIIQGLSATLSLTYIEGVGLNQVEHILIATFLLVVGAFILMWLGNMNATYGVGGPTLIMFVSIVVSQFQLFPLFVKGLAGSKAPFVVFIIVWTLLSIYVTVVFEKAEYRLPITRVSINNELVKNAYLPIRVNPSNGIPIMYAYTFLSMPQYILILLSYYFKDTDFLAYGVYFTTSNVIGISIYISLVLFLSYSFAFVNFDPIKLSKDFRASGDYIEMVRPGKPTQLYLTRYIRFFGIFSGIVTSILLSTPLILFVSDLELQNLTPVAGIFMMMTGMILLIREEVFVSRLKKQYTHLFNNFK